MLNGRIELQTRRDVDNAVYTYVWMYMYIHTNIARVLTLGVSCVILHNMLMWYDGRYVEPDDEGNVYGKGQLSQRKRLLLVGLKHARVARLLAVGDNAPLPPPYGVPGPDDGDLVGGRDPEEEELIPQEDIAS